jgi:hypothetical protein
MTETILQKYISEDKNITLSEYFDRIFTVVSRLDVSVCPTARLHQIHQRRLTNLLYNISELSVLPDQTVFPERIRYSGSQQQIIKQVHDQARKTFRFRQIANFRLQLDPSQRIKASEPLLLPEENPDFDTIPVFTGFDETLYYSVRFIAEDDVIQTNDLGMFNIQYLAELVNRYPDSGHPVLEEFQQYFNTVQILEPHQAIQPAYVINNIASEQPMPLSPVVDEFVDFWSEFSRYITINFEQRVALPETENIIQDDVESLEENPSENGSSDSDESDVAFDPNEFEPVEFVGLEEADE